MGRYAQAHRRGGGGRAGLPGATVVGVAAAASATQRWTFSAPVTVTGAAPSANISIDGDLLLTAVQETPTTVLTTTAANHGPGANAFLNPPPPNAFNWIANAPTYNVAYVLT